MRTITIASALLFGRTLAESGCWSGIPEGQCSSHLKPLFPGPWDANNLSPSSRHVSPVRILDQNHNVLADWPSTGHELRGDKDLVVFDFGKEVGGLLHLDLAACGNGSLGLAFSESSNFTGFTSDESNGGRGPDGSLAQAVRPEKCGSKFSYDVPVAQQRGGFRYLSIFTNTTSVDFWLSVAGVSVETNFAPTWPNLKAYDGYFHSSDELLNQIWYASAYTLQTNIIPVDTAREYPLLNVGWSNGDALGMDGSHFAAIVDGAKRDRAVWSGDLGIAIRTALISLGDDDSVKAALSIMYEQQKPSGELPQVGPPISFYGSDTYHMSCLIGTYDYVLYSGDMAWLSSIWPSFGKAMAFVIGKIDSSGLLSVTGANNWGRTAKSYGQTTDANALLYQSLVTGAALAEWLGEDTTASTWSRLAVKLKVALNQVNWDDKAGCFKNAADDSSVHPEDGNSLALYYNATTPSHVSSVSDFLHSQWGYIGAVTQELPDNISPFIESFEIKAHLAAHNPQRALDLMRLSWGWYLHHPNGTGSTMIEGYWIDGSFRYRNEAYSKGGAYTSHSHAWSTGPVDALISSVVGMRPTAPGGKEWVLEPQFGDLNRVQGGFRASQGLFSAAWTIVDEGYNGTYNVPTATTGVLRLPAGKSGRVPRSVLVDGAALVGTFDEDVGVAIMAAEGGWHSVQVIF